MRSFYGQRCGIAVNMGPEFLRFNEIRWDLAWRLSMQDDDGGVWHKQTSEKFAGFVMPEKDRFTSYVKFIFAPEAKRHPLMVFANPLEKDAPKKDDPNEIYFGPGIHRPAAGVVEVKSQQTLYIAGVRVVFFAHESRAKNMQSIVFRDIDLMHFVQTPFLFEPGEELTIQDLRFDDILPSAPPAATNGFAGK
jgi:hypothetical protein